MRGASRIAIFLPSLRGGGAERAMLNLARGLIAEGFEVDLVTIASVRAWDLPEGARSVSLGVDRTARSIPRLIGYLRRARSHILISNLYHANVAAVCAWMAARSGTRLILVNHNPLSTVAGHPGFRNSILPLLIRGTFPLADRIVAVSSGVAEDLARTARLRRDGIAVVFNPVVGPELFAQAEEPIEHPFLAQRSVPLVLGVGRLGRQKDFGTLIRAFARVLKEREANLLILGDGGSRGGLEALIHELGIIDRVHMPGFVPNPYPYIAGATLFALSSAWEGLPTVLIEAMALGTPVVSTDCVAGPREILQGGKWGRLVRTADPEALADGILKTLDKPLIPSGEAWQPFTVEAATHSYLSLALA